MRFEKWQGLGNDYVLVDERELPDGGLTPDAVRAVCNRNFGIGSDGILVLGPSDVADARMRIHNPDASMAEMCGNGVRMAARFLLEEGMVPGASFTLETDGGIVRPTVEPDGRVRVDMGTADVAPEPESVSLPDGTTLTGRFVSMGNPHFVVERQPEGPDLHRLGPLAEHHERFPNRTNVEFIRIDDPSHVTMRVWERGVGETLACGSGACAVGVTAVLDHGCQSPVTVTLPGGDLEIEVGDDLRVHMTGAAQRSFRGDLDLATISLPPTLQPA